ncbi:MAG: ATP-binding protein [Devosia sp.]
MTALFCDMVNSTGLAEQLDPEEWTEIVHGAFNHLNAPILRYEGTVARMLGDAVLAFFGAPVAHEDDPQRAVLAALDMLEGMQRYREEVRRSSGLDLDVRIGINTGPVVVADIGLPHAMEHTALGDAVNVAARMEQSAAPGTIRISGDTYRLVAPLFEVEPLGEIEVKGKSKPVPAYRVIGEKATPSRIRGVDGASAPLVGRDHEIGQLDEVLMRLREGQGQIVCLIGEAGLGKSRLVAEIAESWKAIDPDRAHWYELTGVPYDATRPFGLFQNFARRFMGIELDDPKEVIHQKVTQSVRSHGVEDEDAFALCSIAFERMIAARQLHDAAREFPAEVIRQDIYEKMRAAFRATCVLPTVMVAEDLHWADPASVDLLLYLVSLVEEVPLLLVCAFRPDRQAPSWKIKQRAEVDFPHRYTEIVLRPLDEESTDQLVSALLHIENLPAQVRQVIMRKADGNPYFVEEIVRTLIEQGFVHPAGDGLQWSESKTIDDLAIPDTLQALLIARMDRLDEEARTTLQLASVIGRSFYFRILQAISDTAFALDKRLTALERVELLEQARRRPELEYMFRHELTRDAAYGSILNRRRREFHARVAAAIETLFADDIEEQAHRLGQHYALAGNDQKALEYYEMAAEVASNLGADDESAEHYARALSAADRLGDASAAARLRAKQAFATQHPA